MRAQLLPAALLASTTLAVHAQAVNDTLTAVGGIAVGHHTLTADPHVFTVAPSARRRAWCTLFGS